jgi:hypothetical protein
MHAKHGQHQSVSGSEDETNSLAGSPGQARHVPVWRSKMCVPSAGSINTGWYSCVLFNGCVVSACTEKWNAVTPLSIVASNAVRFPF